MDSFSIYPFGYSVFPKLSRANNLKEDVMPLGFKRKLASAIEGIRPMAFCIHSHFSNFKLPTPPSERFTLCFIVRPLSSNQLILTLLSKAKYQLQKINNLKFSFFIGGGQKERFYDCTCDI
jgi:hypothetical protein